MLTCGELRPLSLIQSKFVGFGLMRGIFVYTCYWGFSMTNMLIPLLQGLRAVLGYESLKTCVSCLRSRDYCYGLQYLVLDHQQITTDSVLMLSLIGCRVCDLPKDTCQTHCRSEYVKRCPGYSLLSHLLGSPRFCNYISFVN